MDARQFNTFYISEKIAKIRWVPEQLKESDRFVTGTWDMPINFVRLWRLLQNPYTEEGDDFSPHCSDKIEFPGDISGLQFVDDSTVVVGCTDGHASLLKVNRGVEADTLDVQACSPLLHKFDATGEPAPCTGISVYGKEIATVGEDGRLNIITADAVHIARRSIRADSCSLTTVAYVNPREVLTGNSMGLIRMFDTRSPDNKVAPITFALSCQDEKRSNYVSTLISHPAEPHVVLAGSEEGSITVFDLRDAGFPVSYLSAHSSPITEMGFYHVDPTKLFTTADSGELWLWTQNDPYWSNWEMNPWLSGESTKSRVSVTSLISDLQKSINSLDTHGTRVICGTDAEAIHLISNIF